MSNRGSVSPIDVTDFNEQFQPISKDTEHSGVNKDGLCLGVWMGGWVRCVCVCVRTLKGKWRGVCSTTVAFQGLLTVGYLGFWEQKGSR